MRLIDADKLLDDMYEETGIMTEFRSDYETLVDEQPTVNAQPVVYAKFIYYKNNGTTDYYKCSCCGDTVEVSLDALPKYKFCSECGARMDGDSVNRKETNSDS